MWLPASSGNGGVLIKPDIVSLALMPSVIGNVPDAVCMVRDLSDMLLVPAAFIHVVVRNGGAMLPPISCLPCLNRS